MKRRVHLILVAITILLGMVHSAFAFVPYKRLSANVLWFLGTGLALLFCGGLNWIQINHGAQRDVRLIVRTTNVVMLLFMALAVVVLGLKGNPQMVILAVAGPLMLGLSFSN